MSFSTWPSGNKNYSKLKINLARRALCSRKIQAEIGWWASCITQARSRPARPRQTKQNKASILWTGKLYHPSQAQANSKTRPASYLIQHQSQGGNSRSTVPGANTERGEEVLRVILQRSHPTKFTSKCQTKTGTFGSKNIDTLAWKNVCRHLFSQYGSEFYIVCCEVK